MALRVCQLIKLLFIFGRKKFRKLPFGKAFLSFQSRVQCVKTYNYSEVLTF
jgi:hypothetical protein